MPIPIPKGKQITVQLNYRQADYCMPSMEIATDHYDISYIVSGNRKAITPTQSFSYQAGDIAVGVPYLYHRTISESDKPYINYLIKFTPEFVEPFTQQIGKNIFDELFEQRVWHFTKQIQKRIEKIFSEMLEEYNKDVPYKEVILRGMLYRLLITLYENKLNSNITKYKTPLTEQILYAIYYIENNYSKNLTLEDISMKVHFSPSYFSKLFANQLGMSFTKYLSNVRIKHAKQLLVSTNKSITEIALDIGYCNGDYFSTQFKNKTGMTPTMFRRNETK